MANKKSPAAAAGAHEPDPGERTLPKNYARTELPRSPGFEPRGGWVLESRVDGGTELRRMSLEPLPFRVGRSPGLELVLPSQLVSKVHAEIYEGESSLRVRDLHSTNGTFVNRQPVGDAPIRDGDILHFADFEFRLGREEAAAPDLPQGPVTVALGIRALPRGFVQGGRELNELLENEAVSVVLQPIVRLPAGTLVAYEVLGRGCYPGLPESPDALFEIAASSGPAAQARLSRLFRRKVLDILQAQPNLPSLFLNTHPAELDQPGLLESVEEIRAAAPSVDLILEIHESALAQLGFISWLRTRLAEINVGLAYDDFGAGQARLLELAEAPPSYLKFDRRFVSGIDEAPPSRRRLLASLVAAARELLVKTIAEGVETAAEAEVCQRVGFTHAQGYFYGRPQAIDQV